MPRRRRPKQQAGTVQNVRTLLQLSIAPGTEGIPYGTIKLVRGKFLGGDEDGTISYAVFVQDQYLGTLPDEETTTERSVVLHTIGRMKELLEYLSTRANTGGPAWTLADDADEYEEEDDS